MIEIRDFDHYKADPETLRAMALRCEEERHDWRGAASVFLRIYMVCRWCGAEQDRP